LNIEGNPTKEFLEKVLSYKPHQCTLVPDSPSALTSDQGWNTVEAKSFLTEVTSELKAAGIRVSIFINASPAMVEGAALVGADRIEFYTGPYAAGFKVNPEKAVKEHAEAALMASKLHIGVNAGHDLNLENLRFYAQKLPNLLEVSIGHALVCDALYYGLENVISMYQHQLRIS
jgi:pyridoxine 5-phosphate synthase